MGMQRELTGALIAGICAFAFGGIGLVAGLIGAYVYFVRSKQS